MVTILAITFSDFIKIHLNLDSKYQVMPSTVMIKVLKN